MINRKIVEGTHERGFLKDVASFFITAGVRTPESISAPESDERYLVTGQGQSCHIVTTGEF